MLSSHPLLELAAGRTADARLALLRSVADMFFVGDGERSSVEALLFEEIATRVVAELETSHRAEFAARIADRATSPRRLALLLAGDEIAVAQPVLERYPAFSDQDLIELATHGADPHLCAMSRRLTLAEVVTDVLVHRGSDLVLRLLAANEGARMSAGGFEQMVRRSAADEPTQQALAVRRDLPAPVLAALAEVLTERLRVKLLARGYDDPGSLAPGLADRLRDSLKVAVDERTRDLDAFDHILAEVRSGAMPLARVVVALARSGRSYDLAMLTAALAGIKPAVAVSTLMGPTDEPLIVLFKAIDVPWNAFEVVLQMRARQSRQPYGRSPRLAHSYAEMEPGTAQRVLTFLESRRSAKLAAASVH